MAGVGGGGLEPTVACFSMLPPPVPQRHFLSKPACGFSGTVRGFPELAALESIDDSQLR